MRPLRVLLLLFMVSPAHALEEIELETATADLLATPPRIAADKLAARRWAVLPEFGYAPDTGVVVGTKFTHRDLAATETTLDVEALYGTGGEQQLEVTIASPHLAGDHVMVLVKAGYVNDPDRDFFICERPHGIQRSRARVLGTGTAV